METGKPEASTEGDVSTEAKRFCDQYFMIDVCSSLTNKKFARDLDVVIRRAKDCGIKKIIVTSTNIQSSKDALRLSRLSPNYIYCTAGVHPFDSKTWSDDVLPTLKELLSNPECVAVGQCGLDFTKSYSEPSEQKCVFEKLVSLASDEKKPIIVYEREAHKEVYELLSHYKDTIPAIVIQSFAGNAEQLQNYLSLGCYIGITGTIWKDKSEDGVRKIVENSEIPLDRLLIQSDSPYGFPNIRGNLIAPHVKALITESSTNYLQRYCTYQRNEPCSLPVTVEMIAAYYNMKAEDLALKTTYSALKVFGLC